MTDIKVGQWALIRTRKAIWFPCYVARADIVTPKLIQQRREWSGRYDHYRRADIIAVFDSEDDARVAYNAAKAAWDSFGDAYRKTRARHAEEIAAIDIWREAAIERALERVHAGEQQ